MTQDSKYRLMSLPDEETLQPEMIFLYRFGNGWVAYRNSTLLPEPCVSPITIRNTTLCSEIMPYALWQGTISVVQTPEALEFGFRAATSDQLSSLDLKTPTPKYVCSMTRTITKSNFINTMSDSLVL